MKTTSRRHAALGIAAAVSALFAGAAHAQSSVTLYGLIDEGLNFTSNAGGHSAYQLASGDTAGSRWGLKGNEDLGGGNHAVFLLENGFNLDTGRLGQDGGEFGRQAYVGLASDRYGTVTLGRQYDITVDPLGFASLTAAGNWAGDIATVPFDNNNEDWDFRVNNSIKYVSPTWNGLTVEAMYGFSNQAGFSNNRLWGATVNYQQGGLTAAASYLRMNNQGATAGGAVTAGDLFDGTSQQNIGAALSYRFTKVQVAAAYSHVDVYDPTSSAWLANGTPSNGAAWNAWKFDNLEFNSQYYFNSAFWLGASYTFTIAHLHSQRGDYAPKYHQLALMLDYDLSKRTSLYLQTAYQHAVSAHTGTGFDDAQIIDASAGPSSGVNQTVVRLGMMHRF
ncbi:porin [Burkholderia glumae]|uniref:porin n=1 Tax=Burkholderia glumae TaxID=337 RepID=UPI00129813A6|nr:porin [Burkholderia glumae]MCM2550919.1 porin [Burkholderia glumae]NVE24009.1 porin [Burkholderia glumae]QGA40145.1 porin [Burkholderia glumae]